MNRTSSSACLTTFVAGLMALTAVSSVPAQLFPFGKAKTAEQGNLELTEKSGPWLVMVASFTGDGGRQQARRLADELRNEHRLTTYVYEHEFNFERQLSQGNGWEMITLADDQKTIRPIQMKPLTKSEFTEIAVLVGDFPSVDDTQAQKTLEKIKTLQPQSLANFDVQEAVEGNELAGQRLRAWRGFADLVSPDSEGKSTGPLRAAFLLTNPMIPDEYFAARKVDQFVIKLNADPKYSLLNNPGTYSVKVASFSGSTTLDLNEMEKIKEEDSWRLRNRKAITSSKLVEAAKKASLLTAELRSKGYDAYEFHDRHESYVCVGAFDWLTQETETGLKRPNPEIEKTILTFKGQSVFVPGKPGATKTFPLPTKLTNRGITCDAQPLPVLIPKAETHRTAKRFLGSFR